ncbi:MAG: hypothetical protein JXR71_03470 [Bacteroidales bacterium]|nr:hypothetical protein [Bacteroidales bacterium]
MSVGHQNQASKASSEWTVVYEAEQWRLRFEKNEGTICGWSFYRPTLPESLKQFRAGRAFDFGLFSLVRFFGGGKERNR